MTHVFNIDTDAACPQCGKGGSVNGGLCLKCAGKNIKNMKVDECVKCGRKGYIGRLGICVTCLSEDIKQKEKPMISGIGQRAVDEMVRQAGNLIETHKKKIQEAFLQAEDGKIKVGLGINIQQVGNKLAVETQISYVVEKVSDKQSVFVDENQPALFAVEG